MEENFGGVTERRSIVSWMSLFCSSEVLVLRTYNGKGFKCLSIYACWVPSQYRLCVIWIEYFGIVCRRMRSCGIGVYLGLSGVIMTKGKVVLVWSVVFLSEGGLWRSVI